MAKTDTKDLKKTVTVTKTDLVTMLNHEEDEFHLTRREADAVIEMILDKIETTVANGDKVSLPGFGHFERVHRAQRNGRNPQTGDKLVIPAKDVPVFRAGRTFRELVK